MSQQLADAMEDYGDAIPLAAILKSAVEKFLDVQVCPTCGQSITPEKEPEPEVVTKVKVPKKSTHKRVSTRR